MEPKDNIKKINEYKLNNKNGFIQMNINEYNYQHSKKLIDSLKKSITYENIMQYSSLNSEYQHILIEKLSSYLYIENDQIILLNGGDISINNILKTYASNNSKIIIFDSTYSQYERISNTITNNIIKLNLLDSDSDLLLNNLDLSQSKTDLNNNRIICFLCNPNNPTGYEWTEIELKRMFNKYPDILFIVDETYIDFSKLSNNQYIYSCTNCINEFDNIIIMRSFSKAFGLAGLRMSYIVSNSKNIKSLSSISSHKDVIEISKLAAILILDEIDFYKIQINKIMTDKKKIIDFCDNNKIKYIDTKCNFILIYVGDCDNPIYECFLNKNIYIKNLSKGYDNYLKNYIRVSLHPDYVDEIINILDIYKDKLN